jgi:serine protease AprX
MMLSLPVEQTPENAGGQVRMMAGAARGLTRLRLNNRIDSMVKVLLAGSVPVLACVAIAVPVNAGGSDMSALGYERDDTGGLSAISRITGADKMWEKGFFGTGIGVAVIDTGVARVPGLDRPGKVIDGPDLSFDSTDPNLAHTDTFGHGTHIAGIIAGSDVAPDTPRKDCHTCLKNTAYSDTDKFVGIAPEATIINVKVGAYDGAVDVSQVIAGINWVVEHKDDPGLNIRVLNLSFGTDSTNPASVDPLAFAVERAWEAGITVVAAAGNDGERPGPLADPAYSPSVIAVGTVDPMGTIKTDDDVVPVWAQHGTEERPVDVTAPGVSVAGLRVPGSFVDDNTPTGRVGARLQRASGTSQSTAVVSGLAALVISRFPSASPDAVKDLLQSNSDKLLNELLDPKDDTNQAIYTGSGVVNLKFLVKSDFKKVVRWLPNAIRPSRHSNGTGSLEGSRGTYHVMIGEIPLRGETDIFGRGWDSAALADEADAGSVWNGGTFNGAQWTGETWADPATWAGYTWSDNDWSGARWTGARWTDAMWDGARWTGARWSGARWSGARWTDDGWEGARWSGESWSGAIWADMGWS